MRFVAQTVGHYNDDGGLADTSAFDLVIIPF